jgi:hypothetical protein
MTEGMNGFMNPRPAAVVAAALASLFVAAPALAKKVEAERHEKDHIAAPAGSACAERVFSRVFASFHDRSLYTSAPDGDFEAGASGWELGDGAAIVDESSSIQLADALGAKSLELADGASAVSPEICVERGFPSFRFVKRSADGGLLRVAVLYRNGKKAKKAGRFKAAADWSVTRKVSLAQGRFRIKRGQSASVQLKFTASGGSVRMDDVYIDPRLRR